MVERPADGRDDEDMPWNDSPADSSAFPGHEEPDPANVVGDEDPRDTSLRGRENLGEGDTLEERLAAEEPENGGGQRRSGLEVADAEISDPDSYMSGDSDDDTDDNLPAEEAAINLEE